jgi:putative transposase
MDEQTRLMFAKHAWAIEEYHLGSSTTVLCAVDRCQTRASNAQRNHIGLAIRAFVRLEWHRFTTGISWFAAKMAVVRGAIREYLECPQYRLPTPATAQLLLRSLVHVGTLLRSKTRGRI